jgi:hypothetical protein
MLHRNVPRETKREHLRKAKDQHFGLVTSGIPGAADIAGYNRGAERLGASKSNRISRTSRSDRTETIAK